MTERLYYHDSYLSQFQARAVGREADGRRVYLDRTAFYPTSGGQPFDLGDINGIAVREIVDEGAQIAHVLESPLVDDQLNCSIDWTRRFDHMQQHTGQHLLSAVCVELLNASTVSFHLGPESCTIDLNVPAISAGQIVEIETRANQIVFENRPVAVSFRAAGEELGLRKPTDREGEIRIVEIEALDRSACGGTHVRATGEIGPILLRKLDRVRGNVRVEFFCGMRAVRQARSDYLALAGALGSFQGKLAQSEKERRRLSLELAVNQGRTSYADTAPNAHGTRVSIRRFATLGEETRGEAQGFTEGKQSMFLALGENPTAALFAVSPDLSLHAGNLLKEALTKLGGKGGGSAHLGQGSLPDADALNRVAGYLPV